MPINIQSSLPAVKYLNDENIFVMTTDMAVKQDIRPLKILILNLMPNKIETETHLLRVLSNTPLQVDIELLWLSSHIPKNTPRTHLEKFYYNLEEIIDKRYDGMIVTGAPLETIKYDEIDFIQELEKVFEWSRSHVNSSFYICWGAIVALKYFFNIDKQILDEKISGIFEHQVLLPLHPLMRGFDDTFFMPHSRFATVKQSDIGNCGDLEILCSSHEADGAVIIANKNGRQFFVTGHSEYDKNTLANEYFRDINRGLEPKIPYNYFPNNNPAIPPIMKWKAHANLLFSNWLNYFVYQQTPYDISKIR